MNYPELERCIDVVKALREPDSGCPWDLKQTHQSLLKYLIEEAYEFIDAVEKKDSTHMEEEIGDVLFQVLLHTTLGSERGDFSLESTAKKLADKLIRRHPHVFTDDKQKLTPEEVIVNWKKIKSLEKGSSKYSINESFLHAPALEAANNIGKESRKINFDWENYQQVLEKVEEEWQELKDELPKNGKHNKSRVKEEMGDLLFTVAQLARHLDLNPEECLRDANKKFISRFKKVEDLVRHQKKTFDKATQNELEGYWKEAKKHEKD